MAGPIIAETFLRCRVDEISPQAVDQCLSFGIGRQRNYEVDVPRESRLGAHGLAIRRLARLG